MLVNIVLVYILQQDILLAMLANYQPIFTLLLVLHFVGVLKLLLAAFVTAFHLDLADNSPHEP